MKTIVVKIKTVLLCIILLILKINTAQAGLILFTERAAFEEAVNSPLAFEGFNDKELLSEDLTLSNNRFRSTTSHISEGDKSLSLFESSKFTIWFEHDVFAIGFDINELNANNLSYSDSAGHEIVDALKVTDIWNESTFFGVISNTAIQSFSLTGSGSSNATYGFDALVYTAPVAVYAPNMLLIFSIAIIGIFLRRTR